MRDVVRHGVSGRGVQTDPGRRPLDDTRVLENSIAVDLVPRAAAQEVDTEVRVVIDRVVRNNRIGHAVEADPLRELALGSLSGIADVIAPNRDV